VNRALGAWVVGGAIAIATTAIANPVADGPRGKAGTITVLSPPEAVRCFENRHPELLRATPDTLLPWRNVPSGAPIPQCSWDPECGGAGHHMSPSLPDFTSESIHVLLTEDSAKVIAGYWFRTLEPGSMPMAFPLPECGSARLDEAQYVDTRGRSRALEVSTEDNCWKWTIPDVGLGTFSIHVTYVQRIERNQFIYILGSTERWRRPIEQALFSVITANETMVTSNYLLRPSGGPSSRMYSLLARDFRPDRDMAIEVWDLTGPDGLLYGRVTDDQGVPIPRAAVTLPDMSIGIASDDEGRFRIPSLKPGTQTLKIWGQDYGDAEGEVVIFPADSTEIVAMLYPWPDRKPKIYR
jgi:Carboxypeptidase regulatory-like domain